MSGGLDHALNTRNPKLKTRNPKPKAVTLKEEVEATLTKANGSVPDPRSGHRMAAAGDYAAAMLQDVLSVSGVKMSTYVLLKSQFLRSLRFLNIFTR